MLKDCVFCDFEFNDCVELDVRQLTTGGWSTLTYPNLGVKHMRETESLVHLMTIKQVCSYLQVSRTTVWKLAKTSEFPRAISLGGLIRYSKKEVEDWLQNLRITKSEQKI